MPTAFEWSKSVFLSNGLVFEWWSENPKKAIVKNVWFLNSPPNQVIRPFENRTKKVSEKSRVQISGVLYFDG